MEPSTNWMNLIRQCVTREAAAHNVEELANMETCPEDWMHFVHENIDWTPFEKAVQLVWDEWYDVQGCSDATSMNPHKDDFHQLGLPPPINYKIKITEKAPIQARKSSVRGRYMVAAEEIPAGSVVLQEKPFASVLNGEFKITHCANCFTRLEGDDFKVCDKCEETYFCSDKCARLGLQNFHRYECPFTKGLRSLKLYPLAFRMFLHGWTNAMQIYLASKMISLQAFLDRGNTLPQPSELDLLSNWQVIPGEHCLKHAIIAKLFVEILKGGGLFRALQNYIRNSAKQNDDVDLSLEDELLNEDLEHFLGTYLLDNIQRVKFNSFEMSEFVMLRKNPIHTSEPLTDNQDRLYRVISDYNTTGAATYLNTSQFNHSCKPNCNFYFTQNEIVVRSNQRIRAGGEIKISYGPNVMNTKSKKKRQRQLAESYGFNCLCEQCNGKSIRSQIVEEEERDRKIEAGLWDEDEEQEEEEDETAESEEEDNFEDLLHDEPMINRNAEARKIEGQVCYKLAEANSAFEVMDTDKARTNLLEAKAKCLDMIACVEKGSEDTVGGDEDAAKVKRVQIMEISRLETQADELLLMAFGLLGNVHFKCSAESSTEG